MDYFNFLLCAMGLSNSIFFDGWTPDFDIVGALPLEISTTILRLLDGKALLAAALTCRKWLDIIKSDRVLRKKVQDEFRARRMISIFYRPNVESGEGGRSLLGRVRTNLNVRVEGGRVERVMLPRMGVIGKKRKFEHEVGLVEEEKKRKTTTTLRTGKRKKVETPSVEPRLTVRLR